MKKGLTLILTVLLVMVFGHAMAFDPIPANYGVAYQFTGVRDDLSDVATCVHCTNTRGRKNLRVKMEVYDFDSTLVDAFEIAPLPGSHTGTVATRDTDIFEEDFYFVLDGNDINQGCIRVLVRPASQKGKLRCTAQVVDSENNPPAFGYALPSR